MKAKLWLFFTILLFSLSFVALVSAQAGQVYFKEDFNYSSLDQMQAAGWTFTRPAGISVTASAVTLDGTKGDCGIHHATSFSNNVYDWKAEVKSMWLGEGHSVLSVFVATERHVYGWAADGYYKEYSLYRDSQKILHFGNYAEKASQYVVLSMVREGNTFSFYFNGELKNTYTEQDTQQSAVTGLSLVSPWKGDAKYDYYQIGEPTAVFTSSNPTVSTDSFPMIPVLVGGGITAAVVGGIVVYYFFIAGGSSASAGASAGGGVGSAGNGSSGGGGEGGGTLIHNDPLSPQALADIALHNPPEAYPSGEQPISPLRESGQHVNPQANPQNTNIKPQKLPAQNQPAQDDQNSYGQSPGGQQKPPQGQQVESDKSE